MLNKIEIEGEVRHEPYTRWLKDGELEASFPIYIDNNPDARAYIFIKVPSSLAHNVNDSRLDVGDSVRVTGKLIRENLIRQDDGRPTGAYKILAETIEITARRNPRREPEKRNNGNRRPPGPDFSRWK